MARWIRDELLNQPADFVEFLMNDYLTKNGFLRVTRKGEQVWKEGDGFLTMARFLKYSYENGMLHLEAWTGAFRESALTGFVGSLPKKFYRESLEELIRLLHQPIPPEGMGAQGQPIVVQVPDHAGPAVPALVCSILGIVSGLLIPIIGLIFFRVRHVAGTESQELFQIQHGQDRGHSGHYRHGAVAAQLDRRHYLKPDVLLKT